jgi:hypothetical protein
MNGEVEEMEDINTYHKVKCEIKYGRQVFPPIDAEKAGGIVPTKI